MGPPAEAVGGDLGFLNSLQQAWEKRRQRAFYAAWVGCLCLDDDPPLQCEVERVRAALGRLAEVTT